MHRIGIGRALNVACFGIAVFGGLSFADSPVRISVAGGGVALAQTPSQPLSPNDVSWLFPPPKQVADLAKLIAVADIAATNPQDPNRHDPVWPDAVFQQFVGIAASPAGGVAGTSDRIGLPSEAQSKAAWFVAGIRIDAGAPGLSDDVIAQYGQSPQIRLIIQPVVRNADGTVTLLDFAGHLIFGFTAGQDGPAQPGCFPRPKPDIASLKGIVAELAALRDGLKAGQFGNKIDTAGTPLGVHPGLADATTAVNLRNEMKAFLERHIASQRLGSMAIMGLPAGSKAPWIFLAMLGVPPGLVPQLPNGGFVPVHGPTLDGQQFAQMLNPVPKQPRVVPTPHANNLNPVTCQHAALPVPVPPIADRKGSATADVFANQQIANAGDILDLVADPKRSHFFNTDCVSCHTETRLGMDLRHAPGIEAIDPGVLPNGAWNLRNFGWSPPLGGVVQGTVTRRTANETAEVLNYINTKLPSR